MHLTATSMVGARTVRLMEESVGFRWAHVLPLGVVSLVGGESSQSLASRVLVSALCGWGYDFDSYISL